MKKNIFTEEKSYSMYVKKSISKQFRNINILLFFIITIIIFITILTISQNITSRVSKDYAKLYAENAVGVLNTYLNGEIALITKAAHSNAVINWFDDEENIEKKLNAYNEMMGVIDVSSSKNLYLGISKSLHEFTIEKYYTINDINYHDTLKEGRPKDNWYFECIADSKDYLLNVDIDKLYNRKRVWLNYKVSRDGVDYGVICTGLEFSQVVEKLFSEYDSKGVRGLIIDEHGYIHMDSSLLGDENFLYALDDPQLIQEIAHPTLLEAVKEYTKPMDNFYNSDSVTTVLELSDKDYQYATIAPIASTTWSVITLYNSSALFALSNLAPVFMLIPITFILFILLMNAALSGLMLKPFYELVKSIEQVNKNFNERVYGLDREDEIGELAHTIQNMKDSLIDALSKVHYDALTSIYNRRYFDENLHKSISSLSRSNGYLSVLLLDIDHFKKYNDTYGHSVGDECLKKVAIILSSCIARGEDFVARYGGEEFVIVLPNTDVKGAIKVAQKILTAFKKAKIPHISSEVEKYVTVSIGISTIIIRNSNTHEDCVVLADKALYISKEKGRNRYTVYDKKMEDKNI